MTAYEIWDTETSNIIGTWGSESQALDVVREAVRVNGESSINELALILETDDGDSRLIAEGQQLLELSKSAYRAASR